ncbi:MAG: hypothetical protein KAS21_05180 [Candidatus Aminicenantes bacterium]|nr:hypothetical protein [Candidatus Aminicenantes bacterium]MCK5004457.1 hypothetical protein [Candidatus Aminicenantes bacterium]
MKSFKLTIIIFLLLSVNSIYAGLYVNSRNLSKLSNIKYLELIWEKQNGGIVQGIVINYGERLENLLYNGDLTKRSGRQLKFRNIHDAVNHIKNEGWEDIRNYIKCYSGKSVYHFFFKKIK